MMQRLRSDRGFTLVELLVASALSVLVVIVAGSLIISLTKTQRQVSASTATTSTGQVVTSSLLDGMRNASAAQLVAPAAGDQLLRTRTAGRGSTLSWDCKAWYYQASTKTIRYTSLAGSAVATPGSNELKTWTLLASGVTAAAGSTVFSLNTSSLTMTYGFKVTDSSSSQVFQSAVSGRTNTSGSSPCF